MKLVKVDKGKQILTQICFSLLRQKANISLSAIVHPSSEDCTDTVEKLAWKADQPTVVLKISKTSLQHPNQFFYIF